MCRTVNINLLLEKIILKIIDELIPKKEPQTRGRPIKYTNKEYLDAIFYVLKEGVGWEYLKGFPMSGDSARKKFKQWNDLGVFIYAWDIMLTIYSELKLDFKDIFHDASHVKNLLGVESVGKNYFDRGRLGTKISLNVDDIGAPIGILIDKSNIHDLKLTEDTLIATGIDITETEFIIADKGYCSKELKDRLASHFLLKLITPRKKKRGQKGKTRGRKPNNHDKLKKRFVVEHTFAWMKNYRRIFRRKDRKKLTYTSFVFFGAANIIARKLENILGLQI